MRSLDAAWRAGHVHPERVALLSTTWRVGEFALQEFAVPPGAPVDDVCVTGAQVVPRINVHGQQAELLCSHGAIRVRYRLSSQGVQLLNRQRLRGRPGAHGVAEYQLGAHLPVVGRRHGRYQQERRDAEGHRERQQVPVAGDALQHMDRVRRAPIRRFQRQQHIAPAGVHERTLEAPLSRAGAFCKS